jgi:hypothetical protein
LEESLEKMFKRIDAIQRLVLILFAAFFIALIAPVVRTYPPFVKKAQSIGLPANDCTYCHVNVAGGDPLNIRGKWLVQQKEKKGSDTIDIAWLKEYKEENGSSSVIPMSKSGSNANMASTSIDVATTNSKVEPLRTVGGVMFGNTIKADRNRELSNFTYTITKVNLVNGTIQLEGIWQPLEGGTKSRVTSTLISTLATTRPEITKSNTPPATTTQARGPEAAASLGQAAQSTQSPAARATTQPTEKNKREGEEVTEQTQSLYVGSEVGSGCEVVYLKLDMPKELVGKTLVSNPLQMAVILAPRDNDKGVKLNTYLCRIARTLNTKNGTERTGKLVSELNKFLNNKADK